MGLVHKKVLNYPDIGDDTNVVRPSDWNASHVSADEFVVTDHPYLALGDDVDDTDAIEDCLQAAAAESISTGRAVIVRFPPGEYRIKRRIRIEGAIAGMTIIGYGATINIDEAVGHGVPALHFGYATATTITGITIAYDASLGRAASTTATADISRSSRTVLVASTTGMSAGMGLAINSSGEYFLGITGDSGYAVRAKSEQNVIRSVDSSTQLTLDHMPEDDYSTSGYTVTVQAYRRIKNIHFVGLRLVGAGQGGSHAASAWGPEGIRVEWCENVSFVDGRIENFGYESWRDFQCWGVRFINNMIIGKDPADPTNQPGDSIWFYGPSHHGSVHTKFIGNTCLNLRRPEDHGPVGTTTIGRHIVQAGNTCSGMQSGMGAHMCQYVVNANNEITDASNGHYYRAKDVHIIGGSIRTTGTGASSCSVSLGSQPGGVYTEDPDLGDCSIIGLHGDSAGGFVLLQNSVTSLTIQGCTTSGRLTQPLLYTKAKRIKKLRVVDCSGNLGYRAGNGQHGIYIQSDATNPMTVLDGVRIEGNRIGDGRIGVLIDGTSSSAAPAQNIIVRNNHFPAASATALNGQQNGVRLGVTGWYGTNIVLGPNEIWSSPSSRATDLDPSTGAADMHRYYEMPYLDAARKVVGTATSSALAGASWSTAGGTKTTLTKGMRFDNSDADAAEYSGWICTVAGTMGTITAGTTGDIASGSTTLTLNTNAGDRVFPGCYITIAGAGPASANLATRVTAVSGTTVTVANAASSTVTGAAISYTNPTLKGIGLIET